MDTPFPDGAHTTSESAAKARREALAQPLLEVLNERHEHSSEPGSDVSTFSDWTFRAQLAEFIQQTNQALATEGEDYTAGVPPAIIVCKSTSVPRESVAADRMTTCNSHTVACVTHAQRKQLGGSLQAAPAASEKCAFEWLRKHGWTMTGPRVWSHQVLGFQIRPILPGRAQQRDEHAHFLRESWRAQEFALLLQDPRHATAEYAAAPYCTSRLAACRRLVESATGPHRWILLGAATSPLEHAIRYSSRDDPVASCPHLGCRVRQAGWNHALWECPHRGHVSSM